MVSLKMYKIHTIKLFVTRNELHQTPLTIYDSTHWTYLDSR